MSTFSFKKCYQNGSLDGHDIYVYILLCLYGDSIIQLVKCSFKHSKFLKNLEMNEREKKRECGFGAPISSKRLLRQIKKKQIEEEKEEEEDLL